MSLEWEEMCVHDPFRTPRERFRSLFGEERALFGVQAPGRVNLIGEHTDYNGFPVLPMAIPRSIRMVFSPRSDGRIRMANVDDHFSMREFERGVEIPRYPQGDWGNYAKAAVCACVRDLAEGEVEVCDTVGFDAVVEGDIPIASGLSSSSALVVACGVAFLVANGAEFDRMEIAELMAMAERYVGTEGGGMDQATCLLAEEERAIRIGFFPLRADPVRMPPGFSIVVLRTFVPAAKSEEARVKFNTRAVECRLACALVAHRLAQECGWKGAWKRMADLPSEIDGRRLLDLSEPALGDRPWSLDEMGDLFSEEPASLVEKYLKFGSGDTLPPPPEGFLLGPRLRHVLSEADRVERAVRALESGDGARFGRLMDDSHASCSGDYGVSCGELDSLVAAARRNGALGARLTGAGFGGCTVSLVREGEESLFIDRVSEEYHCGYLREHRPDLFRHFEEESEPGFACRPSQGLTLTKLENGVPEEGSGTERTDAEERRFRRGESVPS